jgi:hypothetical protein
MNIEARKLVLIEEFLRISDELLVAKLENFLKNEKKIISERNLKPMSTLEFHDMIDRAIQDGQEGRLISHEDLKKKVKTWK